MSYPPPSDYTVPPPNIGIPPPLPPVVPLPAVPPPFYTQSTAAVSLPPLYRPPPTAAPHTAFHAPTSLPVHYRPSTVDLYSAPPPYVVPGYPPPPYSYSVSNYETLRSHRSEVRTSHSNREPTSSHLHRESGSRYSPSRHRSYERERESRERYYESHRSRSPIRSHRNYSRSPSRHRSSRHSPSRRSIRSPSSHYSMRSSRHLSSRSPSRHRSSRSPSRHSSIRSSSRHHSSRSHSREEELRRYYEERKRRHAMERKLMEEGIPGRKESDKRQSPTRSQSRSTHDDRTHRRSPSRRTCRSPSRETHASLRSRRSNSPRHRYERDSKKPLTDREKILEEYRKNYCQTSEDLIAKMKQYIEEEETTKTWYRCSPAELYYKPSADGTGLVQTPKLEKVCEAFFKATIERGRLARPEVDELPPLKPTKGKMCKHRCDEESNSSSSSSSEDDACLDDDGLQGYTDRIMLELQRKQNHPRRLHPELWFNNSGEMNGGPLCRCSARARRFGIRHGVYAGEQIFPKCVPTENNLNKLYHYRITVSPPTNFLIKSPTIIAHDEHEFLFSGFSMFSHCKLAKLPTCKVIRFNIEYTILYVEEPAPQNFSVKELDLFEEFLFYELLELVDLDLGKATETSCSQFHFMPRFVRQLAEGGCEVLSMCEVLKYLLSESGLLIPQEMLHQVHDMDHYTWQKFVDRIKGMIVTYPGRKPCSVRVDQLDRSPPAELTDPESRREFYPEIVHFGIRPPQLSYAGNPEYQKAWRYYVKYRHLIANMAKPSTTERQKLSAKETKLQDMRTQSKMKRDVTVAISSKGFYTTGLMCDVVQHAMLIPVLVRHLRFHKSLDSLESKIGYVFKQRALLQTALTHPSYRENFGTNPDHARNSLTNCGIRQPEYGDRRIHYTRKKGIVTLINIMSRFGRNNETESAIKHNERLEFLGDAVVEFLSSIHLFTMFPGLAEGGLATYRAAIVQNQHLAQLAKNIGLEQYMLYAHGSDLCRDVVMRHAMANCFEALMGALYLDDGVGVADRVFSLALWYNEPDLLETWNKERGHPLQEQEPLGDRKYIKDFEFLQKLTEFEESIGVQFKHIRLLARAFTDRSVGFTHLTLGSNQRLEFLGDTVLQLVVSGRLYKHFPDHHEGHLSLLRSSLVNNRTQATVCDDLNMSTYAIYNNPKAKPTTKKHKADLLEAFLGALYIDKNIEYCEAFCNACLFPRLQEFIMNQDWNDPKSKLQQCCLTLRTMEGGEPDIPVYKVIECLGPTNTRVYTVAVYFRGARLAAARGHSIQEAEMKAAESALSEAHCLFPQLDHQKRVIAKTMKRKNKKGERALVNQKLDIQARIPKAYRRDKSQSSDEGSQDAGESDTGSNKSDKGSNKSDKDSHKSDKGSNKSDKGSNKSDKGSDKSDIDTDKSDNGNSSDEFGSDTDKSIPDDKLRKVKVSSLLHDMEKLKEGLIKRNEYDKFKEKCKQNESDDNDDLELDT